MITKHLIFKRWTADIMLELKDNGQMRYSDLTKSLTAGTNILADRLKKLIEIGWVEHSLADFNVKVYTLTERGNHIASIVQTLKEAVQSV